MVWLPLRMSEWWVLWRIFPKRGLWVSTHAALAWEEASSWRHVVPPHGAGCCSLFLLESTLNGCVMSSLQRVGIFGEWREVFHGFQPMYVHGCACGEFSPNSAPSCFSKYGACQRCLKVGTTSWFFKCGHGPSYVALEFQVSIQSGSMRCLFLSKWILCPPKVRVGYPEDAAGWVSLWWRIPIKWHGLSMHAGWIFTDE